MRRFAGRVISRLGAGAIAILLLAVAGCGVVFRDLNTEKRSDLLFRSTIRDALTIGYVWQGKGLHPGIPRGRDPEWEYYCCFAPAATLVFLVDLPLCLAFDTVWIPVDLWESAERAERVHSRYSGKPADDENPVR
ncbi:YceK/YidQ family lipoprotein [uncultured Victivallis sp.]|uniref:YceK/YidQ family lipoprotein n=1 Tax=uncultured Victivallis sp. TaxID=354118 RepID=UPI0025D3ED38|nr:YceK/YidQ family lipoprotein [uncultured Victivallis sp.]